jgi:hypothetical protein
MSRNILDTYKEYKIMPTLQMHMLRVAAVASLIYDNFDSVLEKKDILVTTCLLHDMANIIKSNMTDFPHFFEPEGVEYWQKVKDAYIAKYGSYEHHATIAIMKELGVPERCIELADGIHFSLLCKQRDQDDFIIKIIQLADKRVSPHGVTSFLDRIAEAKERYKHKNIGREAEREMLVSCGVDIENQIFAKCKIKPEDINDASVAPIIEELKNFVI